MEIYKKHPEERDKGADEVASEIGASLAEQVLAFNEHDKFIEIAKRAGSKEAYDDGEYLILQKFTPGGDLETLKIYDADHNLCFVEDYAAKKEFAQKNAPGKFKKKDPSVN